MSPEEKDRMLVIVANTLKQLFRDNNDLAKPLSDDQIKKVVGALLYFGTIKINGYIMEDEISDKIERIVTDETLDMHQLLSNIKTVIKNSNSEEIAVETSRNYSFKLSKLKDNKYSLEDISIDPISVDELKSLFERM